MNLSKAGDTQRSQTALHNDVRNIIMDAGFIYDEEYGVEGTKFTLDFYLPEFHVGIEADGPFHNTKKDRVRDAAILEATGILIMRISQHDIDSADHQTMVKGVVDACSAFFASKAERMARVAN
jgi:very-short-patch-repair endonuclease